MEIMKGQFMNEYIKIFEDDRHLNTEISQIIKNSNISKFFKIRQLKHYYISKRSKSQIDYYIQSIKSSIFIKLKTILLVIWSIFIILFSLYRIIEML